MMWFKKWYHERFVNPSKKIDLSIIDVNETSCRNSTETRLNDQKPDQSIVLRRRIRHPKNSRDKRNEANQIIESITENISNNNRNNNNNNKQNVAIHSTVTNVSTKIQVLDKATKQVISETRRIDIEASIRIFNRKQEFNDDTTDSSVTDVNEYGNGESDCDSLSKSKDTRLYCKSRNSTIETTNCNSSVQAFEPFESTSTETFKLNNKSIIPTERNEWLSTQSKDSCHREFLHHRAKELENFISDSSDSRAKKDYKTNNCRVCDEQTLNDWVIVSIELKPIASCESSLDENHINYLNESASTVQYYTTCEYSDIDKQPIVTLHHCPSIYVKSRTGNCECNRIDSQPHKDYGIFYSHNRKIRRLLWFAKLFDFNIKTGTPFCNSYTATPSSSFAALNMNHNTMKYNNLSSSDYHGHFLSSESLFSHNTLQSDIDICFQEPCTSNTKKFNFFLDHNAFNSISTMDSLKTSSKCMTTSSIPEYFGLNDHGDIIIHIDHICEEKGFGFMMRRKKAVYRKVPYGEEVCEKDFFNLGSIKRFFKSVSDKICKCYRGECIYFKRLLSIQIN